MNKEKFLVIGSNSFSGANFISSLLKKGHQVLGVSRSIESEDVMLPYRWLKKEIANFSFYQIDLNKDLDRLIQIINDELPSYIVNFSALGMVAQSWEKPEDWYRTNVLAQVKLHDSIRHYDFIKRYLHVTTPEVYGSTESWISENFNFKPSTPYAVSRSACDLHLASFYKAYKFPVIFTRAANVYGPGQQLYRIIPRAILYARLNEKLLLDGGGYSERSFIHMDDVSEATYRIIKDGNVGETYHISTNELISIRNLVRKICNLMDINFSDLVVESEERLGKDQSYKLASNKIRDELGWEESINLDKGIVSTINWVDNNLIALKKLPHNYVHKS